MIRIRIKNSGEQDLRGMILAGESRDMAQDETADTTAAMAYNAVDLTAKGGAKEVESGGLKVIEHAELTTGWLSILNSEIAGVGHMTHMGVRRVWIRAEAPKGEAEDVQLKLRWRALGSVQWTENSIVPLAVVGDYQLYDLGEARPEPAALGEQRWEWDIQARALSGSGKVRLHVVHPFPVEQLVVVKAVGENAWADGVEKNGPGTVESIEAPEVPGWSNPSYAKTADGNYAAVAPYVGSEEGLTSETLLATDFGFEIPESASITGIIVELLRKGNSGTGGVRDYTMYLYSGGSPIGDNKADMPGGKWIGTPVTHVYGSSDDLWGASPTPAMLNAPDFGVGLRIYVPYEYGSGTAYVDAFSVLVYYSTAAEENRVCFATRSIEFRSDGILRQGLEDDAWGLIVPEGFVPYASPAGLEGRKSRFIIVPTQGDLGELADSGDNSLSAQAFVRPGYLFAREAE